jgi:cyclophilin family peptidyl-prolyl cis-trans isomerase
VGTEKRERQKANRQLKYEQEAKQAQRKKLTKRVVIGIIAAVVGVAFVLFLAFAFGGGDDDDVITPATTPDSVVESTVPSSTPTAATTPSSGSGAAAGFAYGNGACPPADGVTTPVKSFDEAPQLCIDPARTYTTRIVTDRGDIVIELDAADVPGTVNNFVTLARYGYYDDTTIFRTNTGIDIIQGGGTSNTDSPGYDIPDEGSGYTYEAGQLAMARTSAPDSAGGQWFITVTDGGKDVLDSYGTYVVFGNVTEGLDIAADILALAGSDGDTPTEAVAVQSIEITES